MVIAIVAIVAVVAVPGYAASQRRAAISKNMAVLTSAIRDAQSRAMVAQRGAPWQLTCHGHSVLINEVPVVPGSTLTTSLDSGFTCSGQVQFAKLTGLPVTAGSVALQYNGTTVRTAMISAAGSLTIQNP